MLTAGFISNVELQLLVHQTSFQLFNNVWKHLLLFLVCVGFGPEKHFFMTIYRLLQIINCLIMKIRFIITKILSFL